MTSFEIKRPLRQYVVNILLVTAEKVDAAFTYVAGILIANYVIREVDITNDPSHNSLLAVIALMLIFVTFHVIDVTVKLLLRTYDIDVKFD